MTTAKAGRIGNFLLSFSEAFGPHTLGKGLALRFQFFPKKEPCEQGNINTWVAKHACFDI